MRDIIIANSKCYSLTETIGYTHELKDRCEEGEFPQWTYENILAVLIDLKYLVEYDLDDFIPNPYTGVLFPLDLWLREFGIEDRTVLYFSGDTSVGTFTIDDDDSSWGSISSEDERELILRARALADMREAEYISDEESLHGVRVLSKLDDEDARLND